MSSSGESRGADLVVAAVGDLHIDRVPPADIFQHVASELRTADVTFGNAEQMYAEGGCPDPHHATFSHPRNIDALMDAGIDVVSLANNHTLDWGADALIETMERLDSAGIKHVGGGRSLAEAHMPIVVEKVGTRVGFLAYNCTGPDGFEATAAKPGNAAVRIWTVYNKWDYQPATPPEIVSIAYQDDLERMREDIRSLSEQCDVCIVSFHWGQHFLPRVIPQYCFEVGRAAVDSGADVVLGGHPHMLKGAEIYKGRPIFYSLGNFAFEQGAGPEGYAGTSEMKKLVRKHYKFTPTPYPTHSFHPEGLATMIAKLKISGGDVAQVSYVPCYINPNAEPEPFSRDTKRGEEVFDYMTSISESEGLQVAYDWNEEGTEVVLGPGQSIED